MQLLIDDRVAGRHARGQPAQPRAPRAPGWLRRMPVVAGRILLWALVALLLARSGLELVGELRGTEEPPAAAPPAAEARLTPEAAEGFAVRFVHDYLTYDAADPQERASRLAAYVPAGGDDQLGWDGIGRQAVLAVVPSGVQVLDADAAAVTVAARVDDGRWLQLVVPVHSDGAGRLAVSAAPSFVPFAPSAATTPARASVDAELSRSLQPVLESFFRAYGEGGAEDLAYFVPVGRSIEGLHGLVSFEELSAVRVTSGNGDRTAEVAVRWRDRSTGAALIQQYQLVLAEEAGRWYVTRLGAPETTNQGGSQ
jgi:hypothetical protein